MKKIILMVMIIASLTACGNKNKKEELGNTFYIVEDEVESSEGQENYIEEETKVDDKKEESIKNEEPIKEDNLNKVEENLIEVKENEIKKVETVIEPIIEEPLKEMPIAELGVNIGNKAIDFEVELLSGEKVKLSDYKGKPVFLNFWATWCGPCVREMPHMEEINKEYGDKIVILAINGGEYKEDVKSFINRSGYTFNVGINENGDILNIYDSMYIPLSVFIDKDGIIYERQARALSKEKMSDIVKDLVEN